MEIELPNGQIAEFPDDMPHEHIEEVLRQHHSLQRGTATGAFLRSAARAPLESVENLAELFGVKINRDKPFPSLIAESESDKSHPFAQLGGGLMGFLVPGGSGISAMRSIPAWGNVVAKAAPSLLRRAPVYMAEGAALGGAFSPTGQRDTGALQGAALGGLGSAIPSIGRGFGALKERISSLRNLDKLREQGKISDEQYQTALADESALKELSKIQGLGEDIDKMQAELPEQRQHAEQLGQDINSIPEVNTGSMLPAPRGEELVPQAENLFQTEQQRSANAENQLAQNLYRGYEHGVPIAESVVNEIEGLPIEGTKKRMGGVKQEIGSQYDKIEDNLKEQNIVIPRSESLKEIEDQARKSLENSKGFFRNDAEYEKTVKEMVEQMKPSNKGNDIIPAADVLSNYRSLKNISQKIRTKAFSREVAGNKDLQKDMLSQAEEMEGNANNLEELMENQNLGDELDNLKSANKRWREEIVPLYKNSTYQTFLNKGYAPSKDLIYNLRGNGPGQEIIRNIIKKNPTLVRSILGQRYSENPSNIHNFNQLSQEYLDVAPEETRNLINAHRESLASVENARTAIEQAIEQESRLKSEATRVQKSFEEQKKQQSIRFKKQTELKDLQQKISNIERNIPELKKKAKVKNISLKEKLELESKIAKAEKDIASFKKKLMIAGLSLAGIATTTGAGIGMKKARQVN